MDFDQSDKSHDSESGRKTPLIAASEQKDPQILKFLLDSHPTVDQLTSIHQGSGDCPIHVAARHGLLDNVESLLDAGVDVDCQNRDGCMALHIAVLNSDCALAGLLLARGADSSLPDDRGNNPLHIAAKQGHFQMFKMLLANPTTNIWLKNSDGFLPIHVAAKAGQTNIVQLLCSVDLKNVNVLTEHRRGEVQQAPLHLAAEQGHAETVTTLLELFGADVNIKDSNGNTALHCLVLHTHRPQLMRDIDFFNATADELLKHNIEFNDMNNDGQTALSLAAANRFPKIARLLFSKGAEHNPFQADYQALSSPEVVEGFLNYEASKVLPSKRIKTTDPVAGASGIRDTKTRQKSEHAAERKGTPSKEQLEEPSRPFFGYSVSNIDNEISSFTVTRSKSAERMCISFDKSPPVTIRNRKDSSKKTKKKKC